MNLIVKNKIWKSIPTFVLEALVIFFCSNFIVSWPTGKLDILVMFKGGLILCRLFKEVSCEGDPVIETVPVTGGGVSGSGNVTKGSVRSPSSVPLPSLEENHMLFNIFFKFWEFFKFFIFHFLFILFYIFPPWGWRNCKPALMFFSARSLPGNQVISGKGLIKSFFCAIENRLGIIIIINKLNINNYKIQINLFFKFHNLPPFTNRVFLSNLIDLFT